MPELVPNTKDVVPAGLTVVHLAAVLIPIVSATVSLKDDQWDSTGEWMWKNRDHYNGLAVLPHDGGTYVQAPFEDITKQKYDEMSRTLQGVDLTKVVELEDKTDLSGELACAGGNCEITSL